MSRNEAVNGADSHTESRCESASLDFIAEAQRDDESFAEEKGGSLCETPTFPPRLCVEKSLLITPAIKQMALCLLILILIVVKAEITIKNKIKIKDGVPPV